MANPAAEEAEADAALDPEAPADPADVSRDTFTHAPSLRSEQLHSAKGRV